MNGDNDSNSVTFQAIDWQTEESDEHITIHIYGLTSENKSVVVKIPDFKPYVYLELDSTKRWTQGNIELVKSFLRERLGDNYPSKIKFVERKKNYYLKEAKFLWCAFSTIRSIRILESIVKGYVNILGVGKIKLTVHEQRASPILQLMTIRKLTPSGWITAKRTTKAALLEEFGDQFSSCDIEMLSSYSDINIAKVAGGVTKPKVLCYDLECISGDTSGNTFPNPTKITDQVICISATVGYTHLAEDTWRTYCLVNEDGGRACPAEIGDGSMVRHFGSEKELLLGWREFVNEMNPDVITGYNTLSFDDNYLSERASLLLCWPKFSQMGRLLGVKNKLEERRWASSAYGDQCFKYMNIPGRLHIDMFPVISKDYTNLQSYTLNSVSEEFLGDHKVDLPAKEMIQIWHRGETEDIRKIVEYCNKDTLLPLRLMRKMNTWLGVTEMSNVMMVSVFDLITRGQQIRVFSQVYSMAMDLGVVCTDKWTDYKPTEEEKIFVGATVQDPRVGYWELVATYDFCLAGDTLVSLANGTSKRIEDLHDDCAVLAYHKTGFQPQITIDGLQIKGERETIKLTLAYGRTIVCTSDHKFMLEDGTWEYAKNLIGKNIKCGIEYPENTSCELESNWSMTLKDTHFDMVENREKTLAFSRILGYVLSDGCIYISTRYNRPCVEVYLGSALDACNLHQDLILLTDVQVTTRIRNGNNSKNSDIKGQTYCIALPSKLSKMIHQIEGIVIGKRATQAMQLPDFIRDKNCPLAIVREFLGGLFGGDGTAPSLSNNGFNSVLFKWTTIEKYRSQMEQVFKDIKRLLERFAIRTGDITFCKIKYTNNLLRPKDYLENPRYDYLLRITNDSCAEFSRKIGFRYCINKAYKTFIIRLYYDYCELVRKQHKQLVTRANSLYKQSGDKGCKNSLELARKEFLRDNIPIHPLVLSSVNDLNYMRSEGKRRDNHRISLQYKKDFPKPLDFLTDLGIVDWFNKNEYIIKQEATEIPYFRQKVIAINHNGTVPVYDIQVNNDHNFIANGLVAHNCSLYPTTIIAYNLCFSTFVPPGENPPPEHYHDLEWVEHSGCEHDKSVRKTKVTKIICGTHHYRFYKAEIKKGIVPMLLVHWLDARANTRKELKALTAKIDSGVLSGEELENAKLMAVVLDKRQLGYKTASNSAYGGFGSDYSYLPFYPAAASTTAMGRRSIQQAIDFAKAYRPDTVLVYGDSVTADTPILLKDPAGNTCIDPIAEINNLANWNEYPDFKPTFLEPVDSAIEYHAVEDGGISLLAARHSFNNQKHWSKEQKNGDGWQVWTSDGWSNIRKIIRHRTTKKIYRIVTNCGIVDVTQDHSLLDNNKYEIKPVDLTCGTVLLTGYPAHSTSVSVNDYYNMFDNKLQAAQAFYKRKILGDNICTLFDNNYYIIKSASDLYGYKGRVEQIILLGEINDYVYDLETECGNFQAGIGELIVKNTDSCMLHFSTIRDLKECFRVCEEMEKEINKIFPKPMYLELEKIYGKYFLLSKKRYIGHIVNEENKLLKIDKKGVVSKRRDNCAYLRNTFNKLIDLVMEKAPKWKIYEYVAQRVDALLSGNVNLEELVITKSIKDNYKAQNLPHVAVSKKMIERGKYVTSGTRIRYIFIETENKKDPQYKKAEDPDYYLENEGTVHIDHLYYFEKQLINAIDEVLEVKFGKADVLKNLLKLINKGKIKTAKEYFSPKFLVK